MCVRAKRSSVCPKLPKRITLSLADSLMGLSNRHYEDPSLIAPRVGRCRGSSYPADWSLRNGVHRAYNAQ